MNNQPSTSAPGGARPALGASAAHLAIVVTTFLWAAGIVIGRGVHEIIPPVGLSFWRWITAVLVLLPFVWPELRRNRGAVRAKFGTLVVQGVLMVGSGTLVLIGLNFTTAINALLVNSTQPAITVLLAWMAVRASFGKLQLAGVLTAMAGIAIMVFEADWRAAAALEFNIGDILVLLGTIGYAAYAINIRNMPHDLGLAASLFVIMVAGSVLLLPFYVLESLIGRTVPATATTAVVVLVLAVFTSILALFMWNAGNRAIGPNRAAIFVNLMPVFGSGLAIAFLDEKLFAYHIAGAALVFAGVVLVVRKRADA